MLPTCMVKQVSASFDDDEFYRLKDLKGEDVTWKEIIEAGIRGTTLFDEVHGASVSVNEDGEAVINIKDVNGDTASFIVPEDMAVPFRASAREVVLVYDEDAIEPGDGEVLIGGDGE